jgi:hypothetical protein
VMSRMNHQASCENFKFSVFSLYSFLTKIHTQPNLIKRCGFFSCEGILPAVKIVTCFGVTFQPPT